MLEKLLDIGKEIWDWAKSRPLLRALIAIVVVAGICIAAVKAFEGWDSRDIVWSREAAIVSICGVVALAYASLRYKNARVFGLCLVIITALVYQCHRVWNYQFISAVGFISRTCVCVEGQGSPAPEAMEWNMIASGDTSTGPLVIGFDLDQSIPGCEAAKIQKVSPKNLNVAEATGGETAEQTPIHREWTFSNFRHPEELSFQIILGGADAQCLAKCMGVRVVPPVLTEEKKTNEP